MSEIILVTCSGLSSTGKLTSQAALSFMQRNPCAVERHISALKLNGSTDDIFGDESMVIVIDGCSDNCANKKLSSCGLNPSVHIVATDLGIEKRGAQDPDYKEIEILSLAIKKSIRELK